MQNPTEYFNKNDVQNLRNRVLVAQGKKEATLLLKNCQLVNVNSGEIYLTDIGIYENHIVSITAGAIKNSRETLDCKGLYAIPGLIDPHMHVDNTFLWPGQLARVLVPLGTTTIFVDTVNVAHTVGKEGIKALKESFSGLPLRAYFSAPSYCPIDPDLETAFTEITTADIKEMLQWKDVVSIGETVSSKILSGEQDYLSRLALCLKTGKIISGHAGDLPKENDSAMDAYIAVGIGDDHCIGRPEQIIPELRRGLKLFLVEAPGRENLRSLLEYVKLHNLPTTNMCMCIDNISVMDIMAVGYLDNLVRIGLEVGLSPVDVIRMASFNAAVHYNKSHLLGNLAPGRLADIVLLESLDKFPPEIVVTNGNIVARKGKLLDQITKSKILPPYKNSIHLPSAFSVDRFKISAKPTLSKVKARVIQIGDGKAFNTCLIESMDVIDGQVLVDKKQDILKISIIERYGRSGKSTIGFTKGFELKRGAIATSYSIPSNNIVVVGTNEEDMLFAVQHLEKTQGGFAVVDDGELIADVCLPIGGIMTDVPFENFLQDMEKAKTAAWGLGCKLKNPFFTMSQTVLSSLPDVGLTDQGMVDVRSGKIIPVIVEE